MHFQKYGEMLKKVRYFSIQGIFFRKLMQVFFKVIEFRSYMNFPGNLKPMFVV